MNRTIHTVVRRVKVTRTTHEIRVWPGLCAVALADALQKLPSRASIRQVHGEDGETTTLEFVEEIEEAAS